MRPATLRLSGTAVTTYLYNAMEQMAGRTVFSPLSPVGVTHYIYDRDGHLIAEATGTSAATAVVTREYIWLEGMPVMVVDGVNTATPVLSAVHVDHLMRPSRITNAAKATTWSAVWTPWGTAHAITGSATMNLRFTGQYFLIEQGLAYNWHRMYDASTGRYTQPDPLGMPDGPARYAYALNNPLMYTDEEGQFVNFLVGAGLGAFLDIASQLAANGGNWECIDWWQVGGSSALGTVGGGIFSQAFKHSKAGLSWSKAAKNYNAVSKRVRKLRNVSRDEQLHHSGIPRCG